MGAPRLRRTNRGRLALRYDPNIAIALQTGKLRPPRWPARLASSAWRTSARPCWCAASCPTCWNRARPAGCGAPRPRMQYTEVPNVGHAPMLTEPEAAFDAIAQFLAAATVKQTTGDT
jgi:pimeloyl-ACP methyl ester carboxylesterase